VACRCVWSWNLVNEEALAHWGLSRKKKKKKKKKNWKAIFNYSSMNFVKRHTSPHSLPSGMLYCVFTSRYGAVFQKKHTIAQTVSRQSFTTDSIPAQGVRDLGWTNWYWHILPRIFRPTLSVSFPQRFIVVDSYDLVGWLRPQETLVKTSRSIESSASSENPNSHCSLHHAVLPVGITFWVKEGNSAFQGY